MLKTRHNIKQLRRTFAEQLSNWTGEFAETDPTGRRERQRIGALGRNRDELRQLLPGPPS